MRNGYRHKREKHKKGPLVVLKPREDLHLQLQYPQPVLPLQQQQQQEISVCSKPNGVVYADLDMSPPSPAATNKHECVVGSANKKTKAKTEYATLKFNEVGQEIDV